MSVSSTLLLFASLFCVFSYVIIQRQTLKNRECCICRQTITKNEEIVVCPYCQTLYHRIHLSLWLKIRKTCPICKNIIRSCSQSFYFDMEDRYSSRNINISPNMIIPHQSNPKVHIRNYSFREGSIVLECPHCKNILESSTSGTLCHLCGSFISWTNDIESCIKNLADLTPFKTKKRTRRRGLNYRKISYRKIELQKQKKREFFRNELQKQAQLESQEELLLLNQDYFGRKTPQRILAQNVPVRMIEGEKIKKTPSETVFIGLERVILSIMVIIFLILVVKC